MHTGVFIRGGKLIGREHFILEGTSDVSDSELMTAFVKQFYSSAAYVPGQIILQETLMKWKLLRMAEWKKRDEDLYKGAEKRGKTEAC